MGLLLANLDTLEKLIGLAVTVLSLLGFTEYARRAGTLEKLTGLAVYVLRAACIGAGFGLLFALTLARDTFWANAMVSVALVTMLMSALTWTLATLFSVENGGFWIGGIGGTTLWLVFKFIERAPLNNWIELLGFVCLGGLTSLLLQWVEEPPKVPALKTWLLPLRRWSRRTHPRPRTRGK